MQLLLPGQHEGGDAGEAEGSDGGDSERILGDWMAERGVETLRHGPMKPFGLTNPHNPAVKSYAVVQLRQDNKLGTLFNMVGFQTKLKHGEQTRIFRTIPGLENAEFARLGGLHRSDLLILAARPGMGKTSFALSIACAAARELSAPPPHPRPGTRNTQWQDADRWCS